MLSKKCKLVRSVDHRTDTSFVVNFSFSAISRWNWNKLNTGGKKLNQSRLACIYIISLFKKEAPRPISTRDHFRLSLPPPRNPISVNYWLIWPANDMMGKKNFKTVNLTLYGHLIIAFIELALSIERERERERVKQRTDTETSLNWKLKIKIEKNKSKYDDFWTDIDWIFKINEICISNRKQAKHVCY